MFKLLIGVLAATIIATLGIFASHQIQKQSSGMSQFANLGQSSLQPEAPSASVNSIEESTKAGILKIGDKYIDGELPLGDNKYVTDKPKKGYIYLCRAQKDPQGGGAGKDGPWIHGTTWNIKEKLSVSGEVKWPQAQFSNSVSGSSRLFKGNGLPINHTTGTYPVQTSDKAYQYDKNPNKISAQTLDLNLPNNPAALSTPNCVGGEVGVMLSGVPLFNGFDAGLRDAAAHEVQDACEGHPQNFGEYHYHSLSSCINDISSTSVIGFALDGFPITGPEVSGGKYLTTDDLDECHGMTSEIILDGKKVSMYHYVMTIDFPYSVSCFKGKPVSMQVMKNNQSSGMQNTQGQMPGSGQQEGPGQPPKEAITACSGKSAGEFCEFNAPDKGLAFFSDENKTILGGCQTPPGSSTLACIPTQQHQ